MFYRLLLQSLRAGKSFPLIFCRLPVPFTMPHFSRHCLSVFAYCLFGCLVVFCSHALSLVIACAVWRSAGKSFPLIFYRSFSVAVHNVALFTALPECFGIWLPFGASCGVLFTRFIACYRLHRWMLRRKVVFIDFYGKLFLLVLRCNAFYK